MKKTYLYLFTLALLPLFSVTASEIADFDQTEWAVEHNRFINDPAYAVRKTEREARALIARVIGDKYADRFELHISAEAENGNDFFEMAAADKPGTVLIRGNNGGSLASGFNYYLNHYLKAMYNPLLGSMLQLPDKWPMPETKIRIETPYRYRYALNYCTYSYTMTFWDWDEYEPFLDWLAMNGYNLILDIVGQEEVYRRTFADFGYTDEEIARFLPGPAYFAWFYMQNMTGFGGPLPPEWYETRTELARKIHDRMQVWGMNPVLQGYSGIVPRNFREKHPQAKVVRQGLWCGFERPDLLRTYTGRAETDCFDKVSDSFYRHQKEVFGNITRFYSTDPFHEGGTTGSLSRPLIYKTIQKKMLEHDPDAVWILQHWQGNPDSLKLSGLTDRSRVLILDLNSETTGEAWKRFERLRTPWIWNVLHNFGGRTGIDAQPEKISGGVANALISGKTKYCRGIGITPEAVNNTPMVYELMSTLIWSPTPVNFRTWLDEDYIVRRYGRTDEDLKKAYDILYRTVYRSRNDKKQGAVESVINGRPDFQIPHVSEWGSTAVRYKKQDLVAALDCFTAAADRFDGIDSFAFDFADLIRQVNADTAQEIHRELAQAALNNDISRFDAAASDFLELISLQEKVLSSRSEWLLGNFIRDARELLPNADRQTRDLFEQNARRLVTTWGGPENRILNDYSNRQWSGLTESFYRKRWEMWIDSQRKRMTGEQSVAPDFFEWEENWVMQNGSTGSRFPTEPVDCDLKASALEAAAFSRKWVH